MSLALASCGTLSRLTEPVAAPKPPPYVCALAPAAPVIPDDAGIPVAVTDAEKAALTAFLAWAHRLWDHDDALMTRAAKTAKWCAAP